MEIVKLNSENIENIVEKAVSMLRNGGVVVYPTETCYGIGVDVTNQKAVDKLYEYKGFRGQKPFSMAVKDREMAQKYVKINEMAENLYNNYLPGPVTVVSESKGGVAKGVESEWGSIGIRIPDHEIPIKIVSGLGKPITATSANISYKPVPYSIDKYIEQTPKKSLNYVDLVIDAGTLPKNVPSTVLDTTMNSLEVLREGKDLFEEAIKKSKLVKDVETDDVSQTVELGKNILARFQDTHGNGPLVFALSGELGSGKTQFTKGIGEALGVTDIVNSPTYTVINEYEYKEGDFKRVLVHMDTWRIFDSKEFLRSGLQEYLEKSDIVVVEWADKYFRELEKLVKEYGGEIVKVNIVYLSETSRKISIYQTV